MDEPKNKMMTIDHRLLRDQIQSLIDVMLTSPYVGWVLINVVVWSLGLYVVALCISLFGIVGAPIGTALLGLIVGGGQSFILKRLLPIPQQKWIGISVIGAVLGALPIGLLFVWILLVAVIGLNSVLLILGGVFGGIFGLTQAYVLQPIIYEKVGWWVLINIMAGAMCAPLSLTGSTFWLPVFCSLGPITFGILTAWSLRYLTHHWKVDEWAD